LTKELTSGSIARLYPM